MRYLGIDYGSKRIGLALSDPEGKIAIPYLTITNTKNAISDIIKIAKNENVIKIVIGLPISFSGGESKQAIEVKKFADGIKKATTLPVGFENEVLTTKLAKKEGILQKHLDKAAAAIILQSYLDKQKTLNPNS